MPPQDSRPGLRSVRRRRTPAALVAGAVLLAALAAAVVLVLVRRDEPGPLIRLPSGYTYTILATSGQTRVRSTENGRTSPMPEAFDANVVVRMPNGGRWLLSSHELGAPAGSVSRLRLGAGGAVVSAQLIATGLHNLCAGALTPWRTLLVNEEYPLQPDPGRRTGWVWELDTATGRATRLTGMGRFSHEQEALARGSWYLTEDEKVGGFVYRFDPGRARDLTSGRLYALSFDRASGSGKWVGPLDPRNPRGDLAARGIDPRRRGFRGAEGIVTAPDGRSVVFSETSVGRDPGRVWKLDVTAARPRGGVLVEGSLDSLSRPDNLRYTPAGDLLVVEDGGEGGRNELFVLPRGASGSKSLRRFGWTKLEPSGPWFSGKRLILSLMGHPSRLVSIGGAHSFSTPLYPR